MLQGSVQHVIQATGWTQENVLLLRLQIQTVKHFQVKFVVNATKDISIVKIRRYAKK